MNNASLVDQDILSSYELGEQLNQAASLGLLDEVEDLLDRGADVNHSNKVNGMTPLHWAMLRNHSQVADFLLSVGADPTLPRKDGLKPRELGGQQTLAFTPNYLTYPNFPQLIKSNESIISTKQNVGNGVLLKVRLANDVDGDFCEIEAPVETCDFNSFQALLASEMSIDSVRIKKIRKLPNIIVRNEADLRRLTTGTELEVVV
ncbi:hypothetical protein EG68_10917 [Paragonimus skrjabini miyazakii]|uniref:Ankyrin repeat domain-containing protein n=1 Tax=Paragonimus skrjabini miyazakii TaxID=59628 RepID=A0A8S9YER7_9TREM|nr:hypothetical protein EG68_10917 [Paragonimus skrjabini miyazakii]